MRKITKAVFPVAGLGTRFLPATKASPKEMLPVVDKPLIQYAVEEAAAAGITDMIFITGRNNSGTDIAMTAPVLQAPAEEGWRVSFVMPSEYDRNSLPVPSDARIRIVRVPSERLAAIRYSGNWSRDRFKMFETRLTEALAESDWQVCGPARWARYDPPFMPAFMRHNEVLMPVGTKCE